MPNHFVFVDTEATNEQGLASYGRQTLSFGIANYYACPPMGKGGTLVDTLFFEDPKAFWDIVDSYFDFENVHSLWVMAHNWNYDGGILDTSIVLPSLGWEAHTYINDGRPPVIIEWRKGKKKLMMVDTLNFFPMALKTLGERIGLALSLIHISEPTRPY